MSEESDKKPTNSTALGKLTSKILLRLTEHKNTRRRRKHRHMPRTVCFVNVLQQNRHDMYELFLSLLNLREKV